MSHAIISAHCPSCNNAIEIVNRWTPGGVNDYGGYILQCSACDHLFALHVGRDINDSHVASGATQIDTYDDAIGDKEEVLKKHGLA